jgi:lipid A 3-O-deacylase
MKPSLLLPLLATSLSLAAEPESDLKGQVVNAWLENDLVVKTDRHYTNGTRFGYLGKESAWEDREQHWLGKVAGWMPALWQTTTAWRTGISLTQNIYTPRDTDTSQLVLDDRPYAGWAYLTPTFQRRGVSPGGTPSLDAWSLSLGVVGPAALGRQAQNGIHQFRGLDEANGWDNQLDNEPDLGIRYAKALRFTAQVSESFAGQFLPYGGLQVGTVQTFAAVGAQWRFGWNLPDDFGWRSIDEIVPATGGLAAHQAGKRGFYVYLAVEGRGFGYNMLVDGNLYHDSHSVKSVPLVADVRIGVVYVGKRWEISYTHAVRSKEFRLQDDVDSFGSVAVAYKW